MRPVFALLAMIGLLAGALVALHVRHVPLGPVYRTETVMRGSVTGVLRARGRLAPERTARVGSTLPGQVTEVRAAVGDRVRRGQVLARLDDLEQRAAVASRDAQLTAAELQGVHAEKRLVELLRSLQEEGALPGDVALDQLLEGEAGEAQLELSHALAQITNQKRTLALARALLARRVIRAPIAGVVLERAVEPAETIGASPPGPPLFVIGSDLRTLRLIVELPDVYAARIQPGPAGFRVPAHPHRAFAGTVRGVSMVGAGVGAARCQVAIAVDNADGALQPGMSAVVDLPMSSPDDGLRVRTAALGPTLEPPEAGPADLWALDATGRPRPVKAETGVSDGRFVEIRAPALILGTRLVAD